MCGIVGAVGDISDLGDWVPNALQLLKLRGPDHSGSYISDRCLLGATRLAMSDPEPRSNQPFQGVDSLLLFNGEIYNYGEIAKVWSSNILLKTESDTEVLSILISAQGIESIAHLNGMFAFAYLDLQRQKIFLSRDRLGKKPLYYRILGDQKVFCFASTQTPLRNLNQNTINVEALIIYLHLGFLLDPVTMFNQIKSLEPSNNLEVDFRSKRLGFEKKVNPTFVNNSSLRLRELITECVLTRTSGHKEIALSLSGGVDSTILALVLSEQRIQTTAFTVRWSDSDKTRYNVDFEIAQRTAKELCIDFRQVECFSADLVPEYLDKYLRILEEPNSNSTGLSMVKLYEEISKDKFRLCLTGDGADEIFGGYSRYKKIAGFGQLSKALSKVHLARFLGEVLDGKLAKTAVMSWASWAAWHEVFSEKELTDDLKFDLKTVQETFKKLESVFSKATLVASRNPLTRMMHLDQSFWLAMESNRRLDRVSMAHSIEARSPFQDELLFNRWKEKSTLSRIRDLDKSELFNAFPELVKFGLPKKKTGFISPIGHWLRQNQSWAHSNLNWLAETGITRRIELTRIHEITNSGNFRSLQQLWALIVLSRWMQINEVDIRTQ